MLVPRAFLDVQSEENPEGCLSQGGTETLSHRPHHSHAPPENEIPHSRLGALSPGLDTLVAVQAGWWSRAAFNFATTAVCLDKAPGLSPRAMAYRASSKERSPIQVHETSNI
jgi:hypothetical protein